MDVLERVKFIQKNRGLTDSQMAELLGYKQRENWSRIKSGRAPANEIFQMRAARAFPELYLAMAESSQDGTSGGVWTVLKDIYLKARKFF